MGIFRHQLKTEIGENCLEFFVEFWVVLRDNKLYISVDSANTAGLKNSKFK